MQPDSPEIRHLLGVLSPGVRKLEGKSFYLDALKSRLAAMLVETISHLGGTVEGFLNKDVSCVVTCSLEGLRNLRGSRTEELRGRSGLMGGRAEPSGLRGGSDGMGGKEESYARPTKQREGVPAKNSTPRPRVEVYGSRGKALLEKAIRNNERLQGSSVLANARSWGVKIVHVDDFLSYVQLLKAENSKVKSKRPEQKNNSKCPVTRVVKAVALKSPYLKVEDSCRKYKPLHMQSMTFPSLFYSARRSSPFEPPPPPQPERVQEKKPTKAREMVKEPSTSQDKAQSPLLRFPSPCRARKKNLGYCECCQEPFRNQEEHLQSEQHRGFVQDPSHYSAVDQLVASMQPGFQPHSPPEPMAAWTRVSPPRSPVPPSPPDLEHHTHSEAEIAVHTLLAQGAPPAVLSESLDPLATRPAPLGPANLPLYTRPLYPRPDTPSSLYSQPPVLTPENMEPFDFHQPYSDPPVLSPQVLLPPTEPKEVDMRSPASAPSEEDLIHHAALEASLQPPSPPGHPGGLDRAVGARGPDQAGPPLGPSGSSTLNPRKRCRSANTDPRPRSVTPDPRPRSVTLDPRPDKKRRRTSLIAHHRSEPSSAWTGQEARPLTSLPRTECDLLAMVSRHPVETSETSHLRPTEEERVCRNSLPAVTAQTQETSEHGNTKDNNRPRANSGVVKERCISSTGDQTTTSSFSGEVPGGDKPLDLATFLLSCAANSQSAKQTTRPGTLCAALPAAPSPGLFTPPLLPPTDKTCCPPSSQDSHPSLSQSFSSVCIESALVPDVAALSPSHSSSEWDYELLARLCPPPASAAAPSPPAAAGLDMELLQRPCAWTHNAGYESRLYSALQPPTPPPSLCGEESGPPAFARVRQRVEVQH